MYVEDAGWFGRYYPHTIAVNSLSKSNALTGMRLGWVIAPHDAAHAVVKAHAWVTSCASTFAQRIAAAIFEANELAAQQAWYAAQRESAIAAARGRRADLRRAGRRLLPVPTDRRRRLERLLPRALGRAQRRRDPRPHLRRVAGRLGADELRRTTGAARRGLSPHRGDGGRRRRPDVIVIGYSVAAAALGLSVDGPIQTVWMLTNSRMPNADSSRP